MRDYRVLSAPGAGSVTGVVHPGAGLRLRLWLGCLLGGFAGGGAVIGLFTWLSPPDPLFDPLALGIWPWSAAVSCLVLAVGLGLWLDHGIASHLRGLSRAIASGEPTGLGALPAAAGWGELSLLTAQLQSQLARQQELGRAAAELEELRHRLRSLLVAVEMCPPGQRAEQKSAVLGSASRFRLPRAKTCPGASLPKRSRNRPGQRASLGVMQTGWVRLILGVASAGRGARQGEPPPRRPRRPR